MTQTTYLAGQVVKQTLPSFSGPPGPGAPNLKRLLLPQGELTQFYDADPPVRYLAVIELKTGATRGNHYHKTKEEMLYIVQGELELIVEDSVSRAREIVPLKAGDLTIVRPGIAHALRTVSPGCAVEFAGNRFDHADIHRYPLT